MMPERNGVSEYAGKKNVFVTYLKPTQVKQPELVLAGPSNIVIMVGMSCNVISFLEKKSK